METLEIDAQTQIKAIFEAQRKHQYVIRQSTAGERNEKLLKLKNAILAHKDEMIAAMYTDFNKPPFETLAIEIGMLIHEIDDTRTNLAEWMKSDTISPSTNPDATAEIMYEPRGVVLIMGPWNFPLLLCVSPAIAAIAAGNAVILKPSELTPAVSAVIKKVINEAFDEDEVAVVEGGVAITTELLKLPFDHIFLTGSPKVGKIVMEAAAKNLASVTLELGGKSPAIIDTGADMDKAVSRIMKGKILNSGQVCMAADYVLMPAALQASFVDLAKAFIEKAFYKDGSFNNEDYGQIINQQNFDRLKHLFDDAVEKGAKVEVGGVFDASTRRIQPTILSNVAADSAIMAEEIFGPITPLMTYNTKEEAVAFVRRGSKPLAYYVFSEDQSHIDFFLQNSTSGGVCINDTMLQAFELNLPFGGINNSGIGSYHGVFGFKEFSHRRGVFYQSKRTPIDQFGIPPYQGKLEPVWQQLIKS
jgi:aldehyde dehydrogenase (NAD+)